MAIGSDMEQALTALYGEDQVAAVITLKVDTKGRTESPQKSRSSR